MGTQVLFAPNLLSTVSFCRASIARVSQTLLDAPECTLRVLPEGLPLLAALPAGPSPTGQPVPLAMSVSPSAFCHSGGDKVFCAKA